MSPHFPTVPVEAARQASPPPESPRPMVVDDEPMITVTLAAILDANGFAVLTALGGPEALDLCSLMPPELLITDVSMPVMNGFDLALEVQRIASDCEVIFFTGHQDLAATCMEMDEKAEDCLILVKPVHPAVLLQQVNAVLKRREEPRGLPRSPGFFRYLSSIVQRREQESSTWGRRRIVEPSGDQFSSTAR